MANPSIPPAGKPTDICADCPTYEIELCVILHDECDLVGHAFIAIDDVKEDCSKGPEKIVRGFYPDITQDPRSLVPDIFWDDLEWNAPGAVKDDNKYYNDTENLYASRMWCITCGQAKAALSYIRNREKDPGNYELYSRQCNNFALNVLEVVGIPTIPYIPKHESSEWWVVPRISKLLEDLIQHKPESGPQPNQKSVLPEPVRPAYTYKVLSGEAVKAAEWPPLECMKRMLPEDLQQTIDNTIQQIEDVQEGFEDFLSGQGEEAKKDQNWPSSVGELNERMEDEIMRRYFPRVPW